jgi:hypothetical protein
MTRLWVSVLPVAFIFHLLHLLLLSLAVKLVQDSFRKALPLHALVIHL